MNNDNMMFSCKRFVCYAILLSVLFAVVHLAGLREYTSAIAMPSGLWQDLGGILYVTVYVSATALVPVLLIASLLLKIIEFSLRRKQLP